MRAAGSARPSIRVSPTASPDVETYENLDARVDELFEHDFAVIVLDSDHTTFDEVERACMSLFGYTLDEAKALAMRVHTTGAALAAILPEPDARRAVRQLRSRNVRARAERA